MAPHSRLMAALTALALSSVSGETCEGLDRDACVRLGGTCEYKEGVSDLEGLIRELFRELDMDESGTLNKEELAVLIETVAQYHAMGDVDTQGTFESLGGDGDSEFVLDQVMPLLLRLETRVSAGRCTELACAGLGSEACKRSAPRCVYEPPDSDAIRQSEAWFLSCDRDGSGGLGTDELALCLELMQADATSGWPMAEETTDVTREDFQELFLAMTAGRCADNEDPCSKAHGTDEMACTQEWLFPGCCFLPVRGCVSYTEDLPACEAGPGTQITGTLVMRVTRKAERWDEERDEEGDADADEEAPRTVDACRSMFEDDKEGCYEAPECAVYEYDDGGFTCLAIEEAPATVDDPPRGGEEWADRCDYMFRNNRTGCLQTSYCVLEESDEGPRCRVNRSAAAGGADGGRGRRLEGASRGFVALAAANLAIRGSVAEMSNVGIARATVELKIGSGGENVMAKFSVQLPADRDEFRVAEELGGTSNGDAKAVCAKHVAARGLEYTIEVEEMSASANLPNSRAQGLSWGLAHLLALQSGLLLAR